jgi:antibiotic biosynthesis monooxygenase (ABM) superfamily enzyme
MSSNLTSLRNYSLGIIFLILSGIVKIQVEVFWVVPLVSYHNTVWLHNLEDLNLKLLCMF